MRQRSDSFRLGALLSFSGGLQDAYTYNVRNQVFANAQTGNIVLMSQNMMMGNWQLVIHYILPLFAFAFGVLVCEQVEARFKSFKNIHWRQIVLVIEIVTLVFVAFMPQSMNLLANSLVSFACAMQVQAFRKVHGYGYASTMCIGNLRSGMDYLSKYIRDHRKITLYKSLYYFGIIFIFAVGAGIGGVLSVIYFEYTILFSVGILFLIFILMKQEYWN